MRKLSYVLLAAMLLAGLGAQAARADAFGSCRIANGSDGDVVAVSGILFEGGTFTQFYFGDGAGGWQPGEQYSFVVSALAVYKGELYAISSAGAAVYALDAPPTDANAQNDTPAKPGRWLRDLVWNEDWTPHAAGAADGSLWAFGFEDNSLVVAQLQDKTWVPRKDLQLNNITANGQSLALVEHKDDDTLELLWLAAAGDQQTVVRHAIFNGKSWQQLPAVEIGKKFSQFTAARAKNLRLFFYNDYITAGQPLQMATVGDTQKTAATDSISADLQPVSGISEDLLFPVSFATAAGNGQAADLFWLNDGKLQYGRLSGSSIASAKTITELPLTKREAGLYVVGVMLVGAYLVVFAFSLHRSKKWPRTVQIDDHIITFAPWWKRAAAFISDVVIICIVTGLIAVAAQLNWQELMRTYWLYALIPYYVIMEANGQTPGKRLLRIAVVTKDLKQPTIVHSLLRNIIRIIETPILGVLVLLNVRTSQRIGDFLADTFVVNTPVALSDNEQE